METAMTASFLFQPDQAAHTPPAGKRHVYTKAPEGKPSGAFDYPFFLALLRIRTSPSIAKAIRKAYAAR